MTDIRELPALMAGLMAAVDNRTSVPKFPARATEIVREISAYAQTTEQAKVFSVLQPFWKDGTRPEEIWMFMLQQAAHAPKNARIDLLIVSHMPALEKALDAQRRCRVCGCTDDNACLGGCYWVEDDLCSECAEGKDVT